MNVPSFRGSTRRARAGAPRSPVAMRVARGFGAFGAPEIGSALLGSAFNGYGAGEEMCRPLQEAPVSRTALTASEQGVFTVKAQAQLAPDFHGENFFLGSMAAAHCRPSLVPATEPGASTACPAWLFTVTSRRRSIFHKAGRWQRPALPCPQSSKGGRTRLAAGGTAARRSSPSGGLAPGSG